MLLRYRLSDSETVPVAPIFTAITFLFFTLNALCFYCEAFIFVGYLKLGIAGYFETSIPICQPTQRHLLESWVQNVNI
jgi:hypothetical protein